MNFRERFRRVAELVSVYLPIALMGLLALATYWLVRNAPKPVAPPQEQVLTHEPDYFMRDFSIKNFDAKGRLHSEINGDVLRHFMDTDTLEIDRSHMRSVNAEGRVTVATANRALSNADGSEVQLFGNAIVTREAFSAPGSKTSSPSMQFRGEFLHVWVNEERVASNQPVTLVRGADKFVGDTMDYDNLSQIINMHGRVRGTMMPGSAAKTGASASGAQGASRGR